MWRSAAASLAVGCATIEAIDAPIASNPCPQWQLPTEGGAVITCSTERLVVRFEGRQLEPISARWTDALTADGWTIVHNPSAPGAPVLSLTRAGEGGVVGVVAVGRSSFATVARTP